MICYCEPYNAPFLPFYLHLRTVCAFLRNTKARCKRIGLLCWWRMNGEEPECKGRGKLSVTDSHPTMCHSACCNNPGRGRHLDDPFRKRFGRASLCVILSEVAERPSRTFAGRIFRGRAAKLSEQKRKCSLMRAAAGSAMGLLNVCLAEVTKPLPPGRGGPQ